ncbi:hypothetical protein [Megasphaera sp.]|uniref:hypothetical protein n=1 Tax=Megasphaera sp. TaxID=2023260 RepID=UPI0035208AD8
MINFSENQKAFLKTLKLPFNLDHDLSDEEFFMLDDCVSDYLEIHGIDANDEVNEIGRMCESILDVLAEQE